MPRREVWVERLRWWFGVSVDLKSTFKSVWIGPFLWTWWWNPYKRRVEDLSFGFYPEGD